MSGKQLDSSKTTYFWKTNGNNFYEMTKESSSHFLKYVVTFLIESRDIRGDNYSKIVVLIVPSKTTAQSVQIGYSAYIFSKQPT